MFYRSPQTSGAWAILWKGNWNKVILSFGSDSLDLFYESPDIRGILGAVLGGQHNLDFQEVIWRKGYWYKSILRFESDSLEMLYRSPQTTDIRGKLKGVPGGQYRMDSQEAV